MNTALDKAISDHMAHGAGSCFDPMHDLTFDTACAQEGHVHATEYAKAEAKAMREVGWFVGWLLAIVAFVIVVGDAIRGCDDDNFPEARADWLPGLVAAVTVLAAIASAFYPWGFAA
jgi:hypothetical protein